MGFDKKEILALATLAKLNLSDQEIKDYQQQLAEVLAYVDKIKKIKLDKNELSSTSLETSELDLRPDTVRLGDKNVFKQAHNISRDYLVAPHVFKK